MPFYPSMNRYLRQPLPLLCGALLCSHLPGQAPDAALEAVIAEEFKEQFGEDFLSDEELKELLGEEFMDELLPEPEWDMDLKARTGLGYGDNVLFGAYEQVASAYFLGTVDGLVYRLAEAGETNAYLYFYGEHMEYFEDVDPGRLYITQGQASRALDEFRTLGLTGTHIFYDQVFDASADLDSFDTFGVSAHQMEAVPHVEAILQNGIHLKLEAIVGATRYEDSYEDSDNAGSRLTLRKPMAPGAYLEATFLHDDRSYREKQPRDADGYSMDGSLRYRIDEASLRWRKQGAGPEDWQLSSQVRYLRQADNASGYYDYERVRLTQSATRMFEAWEAGFVVGFTRYDYDVRKADFSGTETLWRESWEVAVDFKRSLGEGAWLFLDGQREHNRSNSPENVYDALRVSAGVEWEM